MYRAALFLPLFLCVCSAKTLVVDLNGFGDFKDIQAALDAAADGDTVLVMPGEYFIEKPLRFNRDPLQGSDPKPIKDIILTSAGGPAQTVLRASPNNARWVLRFRRETPRSVLRGFTITMAEPAEPGFTVTGIRCNGSPVIENCIITGFNQWAVIARIPDDGPPLRLVNCEVSYNTSPFETDFFPYTGAAVVAHGGRLVLLNCVLKGNVGYFGVALYMNGGSLLMRNCLVTGNLAKTPGGTDASSCIVFEGTDALIQNCTIARNRSEQHPSDTTFRGTIGGFSFFSFYPTSGYSVRIENSIIWDNGDVSFELSRWGRLEIINSCFVMREVMARPVAEGAVEGCINEDPLFVDPEAGDFRLRPESPAIDAGSQRGAPKADLDGNPRPCWGGVDMGAYEYCGQLEPVGTEEFIRGDVNDDGGVDLADVVYFLGVVFGRRPVPECMDAADTNDDGAVNLADAISLLSYLYKGDSLLESLRERCGIDSTADDLSCDSFRACGEILEWDPQPWPRNTSRWR